MNWKRSTGCVADHHCVEVAFDGENVFMRNSQRPELVHEFTRSQWRDFIRTLLSAPVPR